MKLCKTKLVFTPHLPDPKQFGSDTLVIFDRTLLRIHPQFKKWTQEFSSAYPVSAGEDLKDLTRLPHHLKNILRLTDDSTPKSLIIIAVGGGSVGDFAGFLASILKRGVKLVHIPSTWLSALDSSHGGKTALNVGGVKNQIGTYYAASQVFLVRELLFSQNSDRVRDAFGELAKIALINGGKWTKQIITSPEKEGNLIWKFLPDAIAAKYKIVAQDPFEQKGIRQVLNLGHTLGHALEAWHGLSHGTSVGQGLLFCLEWSRKKRILKKIGEFEKIHNLLTERFLLEPLTELKGFRKIPEAEFFKLIRADKKRSSTSEINMVFIAKIGSAVVQSVPIQELLAEAKAQGWVQ